MKMTLYSLPWSSSLSAAQFSSQPNSVFLPLVSNLFFLEHCEEHVAVTFYRSTCFNKFVYFINFTCKFHVLKLNSYMYN